MMAAARSLLCACAAVALLAGTAVPDVAAQQTIQVATPSNTRVLLHEAENLLARNDGPAAYDLLSAHESELAGNAYFDYLLGVAALDTGRTSEAILSLRRSVASAPGFSGARMELARAHFDAGEPHAARPLFAKLLSENPPPGVRNVIEQYIAAIDADGVALAAIQTLSAENSAQSDLIGEQSRLIAELMARIEALEAAS